MIIKTIATGVALTLAVAASATAQTPAKTSATVGPAAPIPYGQLKAYSSASAKAKATRDWSATASTGAAVDTSTTAPTAPEPAVNPAVAEPEPSIPMTPSILPGSDVSPEPGSNLPGSTPGVPPTPK